jgi:hypothetical protein
MKKLNDIFELQQQTEELRAQLHQNQMQLKNELGEFISDYFGGKIPRYLPLSKSQFISLSDAKSFRLALNENDEAYWIASGYLVSVKDGGVVQGHSVKELFQAQYDKFSPEMKHYTIEQAKILSKPVFNIISRDYGGVNYSNIGYELARNDELEIFLVWRKAGMAYVDRMNGSMAASSELQILPFDKRPEKNREQYLAHYQEQFQNNAQLSQIMEELKHNAKLSSHFILHEGGKLNRNLILEHSKTINALFGNKTTSEIVLKLEDHGKKKKVSDLKEMPAISENSQKEVQNNSNQSSDEFIEVNGQRFRI